MYYDLDYALTAEIITGQMRYLIFLRYALELNVMQVLTIMHLNYTEYLELDYELFENIEAIMNGHKVKCKPFENYKTNSFKTKCLLVQIKHVNPFSLGPLDGLLELLSMLGDDLAASYLGLIQDERTYTNNITVKPYNIKEVPETGKRKTASNDEFYRQDLRNNVFYGDHSLLLAELKFDDK
ncbi:hypothetical protein ACYSNW_01395 [Enterococcus sp. LJL99]